MSDEWIGVVSEQWTFGVPDNSAHVQGLPGRMCGWNKRSGPNAPIIYAHRDIIDRYLQIVNNGWQYTNIEWISTSTTHEATYVHQLGTHITHVPIDDAEVVLNYFWKFDSFIAARDFGITRLSTQFRSRSVTCPITGKYLNTIRSQKRVMDLNYVMDNRNWGLNARTSKRLHVCYTSTGVETWIIAVSNGEYKRMHADLPTDNYIHPSL